jgi:Zn-dependent protease
MKMSLYIGKIAGIKLFIHWTFLLLIAWVLISNYRNGFDSTAALYSVALVLSAFFCVTLHEFGHALTAKYFHYNTRDITLLPIGGMARMDEFPEKPRHELAVSIAGPLVNVAIALILLPFVLLAGMQNNASALSDVSWNNFLSSLFFINVSLAVFNLLPAFPMDGGRVFRALLSFFTTRVKATHIAARTGQVVSVLFVVLGVLYNPVLAVIGVFIFLLAQAENQQVKSVSILQGYTVNDVLMKKYYSLDEFATIDDAVKGLLDVQATDFLIMRNGIAIGTLNRTEIIKALTEHGKMYPVTQAMNAHVQILTPGMPLDKVFGGTQKSDSALFPVMQGEQLVGVVDMNNILELVMVIQASEGYRNRRAAA